MTLKGSFPGMFPGISQHVRLMRISLSCHKPYVPCQMLTSRKAELAWWKFSTEKPLTLLFFRRSLRITRHAVVVRSIVFRAFLGVTLSHFYIVGAARCSRPIRTTALQRQLLPLGTFCAMCRRRILRKRSLAAHAGKAVSCGSLWCRVVYWVVYFGRRVLGEAHVRSGCGGCVVSDMPRTIGCA
jgi:hypothetical protein